MAGQAESRVKWALAALVAVLVCGGRVLRVEIREGPLRRAAGSYCRLPEMAREAGITFRMNLLPNEQGEKFKVNLYDHGCGLAVGDFDGDGFDDIYFVNQLGPNALYRNTC